MVYKHNKYFLLTYHSTTMKYTTKYEYRTMNHSPIFIFCSVLSLHIIITIMSIISRNYSLKIKITICQVILITDEISTIELGQQYVIYRSRDKLNSVKWMDALIYFFAPDQEKITEKI